VFAAGDDEDLVWADFGVTAGPDADEHEKDEQDDHDTGDHGHLGDFSKHGVHNGVPLNLIQKLIHGLDKVL
jgi:hypothetical protein